MLRIAVTAWSGLLSLALFVGQPAGDARATQLLAQAREALGGAKAVARVSGLSATGSFTRSMPDRQLSGELTIDLQLPDKMLRTESMSPMGDATIVTLQGINGDQLLRNARTIGGGPNMIIRMQPPAAGTDAEAQGLRNARAELARLSIALLLEAPQGTPIEFAAGGTAESSDGKADIVDAKGPGSFLARLFLDQTTHRPLMLSYKGVAPQMTIRTQQGDAPQRVESTGRGDAAAPNIVELTMYFDDYRQVDGVWLPHHISRSADGKPSEEWTFKAIKVNPAFKADTFLGK